MSDAPCHCDLRGSGSSVLRRCAIEIRVRRVALGMSGVAVPRGLAESTWFGWCVVRLSHGDWWGGTSRCRWVSMCGVPVPRVLVGGMSVWVCLVSLRRVAWWVASRVRLCWV